MGIGKTFTLCGQSIDVGCGDFPVRWIIRLHIAISQVVGIDDDHIGIRRFLWLFFSATPQTGYQKTQENGFYSHLEICFDILPFGIIGSDHPDRHL